MSERTRLRRGANRAAYDRTSLLAVLDAGMVAHVGVSTGEGPVVLPMAYARTDDRLYLHGATGNALLAAAVGHDICVTVKLWNGLRATTSPSTTVADAGLSPAVPVPPGVAGLEGRPLP
jgi:uncharacterized protein